MNISKPIPAANPGYLGNCIRQIVVGVGDEEDQEGECYTQASLYPDQSSLCLAVHQVLEYQNLNS